MNVDDADLDGDDEPDYRIPPAWEYGVGYRPPRALTGDLAKLVRYVALDLLMTTSPLYPVELPTREPPTSIDLDSNTYEGWPGVDAVVAYIKPRSAAVGAVRSCCSAEGPQLRQPGLPAHRSRRSDASRAVLDDGVAATRDGPAGRSPTSSCRT